MGLGLGLVAAVLVRAHSSMSDLGSDDGDGGVGGVGINASNRHTHEPIRRSSPCPEHG